MDKPARKNDTKDLPRTFMTPAYLEEIDTGTYGLFRDIMIETDEKGEDGQFLREKFGKRIGPVFILRRALDSEQPDMTTSLPDGTVLMLKKIGGHGFDKDRTLT